MNTTIIVQTTNQKQSEKTLKWKKFGKLNIKTYPHPTLNFSKGVINSPDLASCSLEEIRLHFKPQGLTDVRKISICKLHTHRNVKCGKKNYRNKIHKKHLLPQEEKNS